MKRMTCLVTVFPIVSSESLFPFLPLKYRNIDVILKFCIILLQTRNSEEFRGGRW